MLILHFYHIAIQIDRIGSEILAKWVHEQSVVVVNGLQRFVDDEIDVCGAAGVYG